MKANKRVYEAKFPTNLIFNDEIEKKIQLKKEHKNNSSQLGLLVKHYS
jgi:hypothetical protein